MERGKSQTKKARECAPERKFEFMQNTLPQNETAINAGFLTAVRADHPDAPIHYRFIPPTGMPENVNNRQGFISSNPDQIKAEAGNRGIYAVINVGETTADSITHFCASFIDYDDLDKPGQMARLNACPLPPSAVVETFKGYHAYWFLRPGATREQWKDLQIRLIAYFGSDPRIKDEPRVMRLPGFDHLRVENGELIRTPVNLTALYPDRRYAIEEMLEAYPPTISAAKAPSLTGKSPLMAQPLKEGEGRNQALFDFLLANWKQGFHTEITISALACARNSEYAEPMSEEEVGRIVENVLGYEQEQREEEKKRMMEEVQKPTEVDIENFGMTGEQMLNSAVVLPEYLIYGTARGQVSAFLSDNGVGKTTVQRNCALSACAGRDYLDLVKGGKPLRVAYLDFEDDKELAKRDIQTMCADFDPYEVERVQENLLYICDLWINGDQPFKLTTPEHWTMLLKRLDEFKPDIIFVDTMAEGFEYIDENSNSEMSRVVVKPLKALANRYSAAVFLAHHTSKNENGVAKQNRMRGASSLGGAMRSQYYLSLVGEGTTRQVQLEREPSVSLRDSRFPSSLFLPPEQNIIVGGKDGNHNSQRITRTQSPPRSMASDSQTCP